MSKRPAGYERLPDGVRCRCIRLWTDGEAAYCCRGDQLSNKAKSAKSEGR